MAILERAIRGGRREGAAPSEDPEFVLLHVDGLESFGFCIHYKMPHYVTFQSSLNQLRDGPSRRGSREVSEGA